MGERKGQNKYYPPDFDYKVHKSLSGYHGQHPLRERARKLDKGILIIRFEMPYNIWCDGCNSHIGMGVRYNAEKSKIGMYYTTPIYMFRMKCHLCPMHFEIKTDPANHDYVIIVGARRKEQRWDPTENGQIVPEDRDSQKKLALDSMYKIEHGVVDKKKLDCLNASKMVALVDYQSGHKEDFLLNQLARKRLRDTKKVATKNAIFDNAIKNRLSISLNLLPEHEEDMKQAKIMKLSTIETYEEKAEKRKKKYIGGVLFPNIHSVEKSAQTLSISNDDTLAISTSSEISSAAREISVKKIQQIASLNINKLRANAFDLDNDHINLTKSKKCQNISKEKNLQILPIHSGINPSTDLISNSSLNKSDNEVINNRIQEINVIKSPYKVDKQIALNNHTDIELLDKKICNKNLNDLNREEKRNVLDILSNLYESSASSISDDDYL